MASEKLTGFIITAGHLDIEWYQPLRSYRFWTIETFEDLKTAAQRDDFVCYVLDGQVFPLEEYLEVAPGDEAAVGKLIQEGKLVIGPFYTQFDEWLPSAENMIRNCLVGCRRAARFGRCMKAGYLPDNFGHPRQLPQILRQFGIDNLMFMRGFPEIPGGHPDEFLYRGIDGSEVLVSHFRESYSGAFDIFSKQIDPILPREVPYYGEYLSFEWHRELADHDDPGRIATSMIQNVRDIHTRYPSGVVPLIAGFDHLPPQINIGDSVRAANAMQNDIEFVMGDAEEYVRAVQSRDMGHTVYDMELLGSRYQNILLGALSTRNYLKRENFICEALVERYAEPLHTVAARHGARDLPRLLEEAWEKLLINSAHDSIHGSSTDEVHVEMQARNADVRQIAAGVIHGALAHWSAHVPHWWTQLGKRGTRMKIQVTFPEPGELEIESGAKGVLSYAPTGAGDTQPTEVWLPVGDEPVTMVARDGTPLPTQVLDREPVECNGLGEIRHEPFPAPVYRKVLFSAPFTAGQVASYAAVLESGSPATELAAGDAYLENEYLRVVAKGALVDLYDKKAGRWYRGLNLLEEEADAGDAWDFANPWTPGEVVRSTSARFTYRLVESGPVRAALELRGTMSVPAYLEGDRRSEQRVPMPVCFVVQLYAGLPRMDVKLVLENNAKDHRVRLRVAPLVPTDFVRSQGHLAILDRPVGRPAATEDWYQPVTQVLPFREWLAVEGDGAGLAIAAGGLYDYEAFENPHTRCPELALTLLRGIGVMGRLNMMQRKGSASWAINTPGAQCPGTQEYTWSYLPYSPVQEEKAPFLAAAQSFLYPPVCHAVRAAHLDDTMQHVQPPRFSWEAANIQFSAFKQGIDGEGDFLRVYENQGRATTVVLGVPGYTRAWRSDMNETQHGPLAIEGGGVTLAVKPYEAVTIKLT